MNEQDRPLQLSIDTVRTLAMDAIQKANSGHPGAPLGMAPTATVLWQEFLRYDPADPGWPDRDRFVLSAGHASMLLYSLLHLSGVRRLDESGRPTADEAVPLDEIQRFRQLNSLTPGHPEFRLTAGVETTTGPLGQGAANSVGMAIAGRWLAARYNRPGFTLFNYDVWALLGDGCMMEGVSAEAASLAGHLRLGNLCWVYDANRITIEGSTGLAFSEDVAARFRAYGWRVEHVSDANDLDSLRRAFHAFRDPDADGRPLLIVAESHIAWGAPRKQDTAAAHGEPLGDEEIRLTKRAYGWPEEARFLVPEEARGRFADTVGRRGGELRRAWTELFAEYRRLFPEAAAELDRLWSGGLPEGWDRDLPVFAADSKGQATRVSSGQVLNALAARIPWLLGGSADLAPSTKTRLEFPSAGDLDAAAPGGRNLHFGVREHAMGAILNGMALGGLRPYGSTFLVFSDYNRPAIRLAALMELPVIHIFTHDSIAVGEDGPTHQPVEHLAALRAIPGLIVLRPADANEAGEAWRVIMGLRREPAALVLTRQNLPVLDRSRLGSAAGVARGAYVLAEADGGAPDVLLLASGSEVALCLQARLLLQEHGVRARVVSMPSWELFEKQPAAYRAGVLPAAVRARVAVEMAVPLGWDRYVGDGGRIMAMSRFGASAPLPDLQREFGFTAEAIARAAREQVGTHRA